MILLQYWRRFRQWWRWRRRRHSWAPSELESRVVDRHEYHFGRVHGVRRVGYFEIGLFGGGTGAGQVQMHYPTERVRIVMQPSLPRGHVFMHPIATAAYEAYHVAAEESQQLQWEHVEDNDDDDLVE